MIRRATDGRLYDGGRNRHDEAFGKRQFARVVGGADPYKYILTSHHDGTLFIFVMPFIFFLSTY